MGLTSPDGHCFLRALNDPGQDKDDPGQNNEIKRTQILLGRTTKKARILRQGHLNGLRTPLGNIIIKPISNNFAHYLTFQLMMIQATI